MDFINMGPLGLESMFVWYTIRVFTLTHHTYSVLMLNQISCEVINTAVVSHIHFTKFVIVIALVIKTKENLLIWNFWCLCHCLCIGCMSLSLPLSLFSNIKEEKTILFQKLEKKKNYSFSDDDDQQSPDCSALLPQPQQHTCLGRVWRRWCMEMWRHVH